ACPPLNAQCKPAVPVYIGEQVSLTGVLNGLPEGVNISSQKWTQVPQGGATGAIVSNYFADNNSGVVTPSPNPMAAQGACQSYNDACLIFYWVGPGTWQFTLTY